MSFKLTEAPMSKVTEADREAAKVLAEQAANFAGYEPSARMRGSFVGYVMHLVFESRARARQERRTEALEESVMRTHILRSWPRERLEKFALHLLGDKYQEALKPLESDEKEASALYEEIRIGWPIDSKRKISEAFARIRQAQREEDAREWQKKLDNVKRERREGRRNFVSPDGRKYILEIPKGQFDLKGYQFLDREHAERWISQAFCAGGSHKVHVFENGKEIEALTFESVTAAAIRSGGKVEG